MMIDPNIAMGYRPIQVEPQSNALMRALGIQNAMTQQRAMQQQMAAQDRAIADQDRRRGIYQQGGDIVGNLKQAGYVEDALKLQRDERDARKADADATTADLQAAKARFGLIGQAMGYARDQATWTQARNALQQQGIDMTGVAEEFHPESAAWARQQAVEISKQIDQELAERDFAERQRHNQTTEQNQRRGQDMNYRAAVDAAGVQAGKQDFERSDKLRDEHRRSSENFIKIRDAFANIQAAAASPSAAGDLSLIFAYMKLLDPTSAVREGEFANAQNATGVPDQIRNMYNRAKNGQRLNDAQRADFVAQAGKLYQNAEQAQSQLDDQYRGYSRSFGVDPANVVGDYRLPKPGQRRPPAQPAGGPSIDDLVKKYGG